MMKHRVVLATLLCVTASCREHEPMAPIVSPVTLVPQGSVQVLIQQDRHVAGDSAVFIVSIVPNGVPVAAYQGVVTFSPDVMEVMSVRTPEAKDGEFRVVNAEERAAGRIRFAVFAAEALASTEAFRIVAHVRGGLAASHLVGALDVVGEVDGQAVAATQLRRSVGVYDATTNALLLP